MRTRAIHVPVNADELKKFKKLAADEHKSLAQLIREFLYSRLEDKRREAAA